MSNYDATLQMFVEPEREIDFAKLQFMRWLGEQGRLEHPIAGPSSDEIAGQIRGRTLGPRYSGKA